MNKEISILYRKLTDINAKFCCLCYNHVNEETACVQDFVLLGPTCDNDAKESFKEEEVGIHYILQQILGSKVAAYLSEYDPICDQCVRSAISSYKFIKTCRENAESMAYSVEAFTGNLEGTEGMDLQDYQTVFIIMDFEESKCTQYYDTAKFADTNAALYKYQTLFRPYRKAIDKKGLTKYKCTKCQSVYWNVVSALTHFRVKHNDNQRQCLEDKSIDGISDDEEMENFRVQHSNDEELCLEDEMINDRQEMTLDDIDGHQNSPDWTKLYNRNNIKCLNELSHEVILDCDGVHKYKCKICEAILSTEGSARGHFKTRHVQSYKAIASRKRSRNHKVEKEKANALKSKFAYLDELHYCRDKVKRLNELSHIIITDSHGATKYKCRECSSILGNPHAARRHYLIHHVKETKFEEDFSKDDNEIGKYKKNNTQEEYICIYCNEKYDNKYILIEHILKDHAVKSSEIHNEAPLEDIHLLGNDIYNHVYTKVKDENDSTKFSCKICLKLYKNYQSVRAHFVKIHVLPPVEEEQYICCQCGKEFKTKEILGKHEERHVDMKLICGLCFREYKNKVTFKDHKCPFKDGHLNIIQGQKSDSKKATEFICDECGNRYGRKNSLRAHINRNHGMSSKKFKCPDCPKAFYERNRLKYHQVTHTKERNFACDICGDLFVAKNALVYHTRIHTGERPYDCSHCGMKFLNASRRTAHVKRHHIAAMATCTLCGITIKECGMRKHMRRHRLASSKPASTVVRSVSVE